MQLVLFLLHHEVDPPPDGPGPPGSPLLQDLPHPQHLGSTGDQHVEVAGKGVLQGCQLVELGHQLVRVHAPLQVDGQFQAGEVRLVPHVGDLFRPARLDELRHLVQDGLHGGGVGDLVDLDEILLFDVAVLGPDPDAAPAGLIDLPDGVPVEDQLSAGGEIRRQQGLHQVAVRVLQIGDGGVADLLQIEPTELGGHAHGDAAVGGHQNVGEGGGQQGRLRHGVVVVIHEVHRVGVNIPEQLGADGRQLGLCVPGGGPGHVPGVDLAEVAFGIHKRRQQGAVAPGEAHHGVVDGGVAVGVEAHGLAHDVGGLGPGSRQQTHLVHGVQQLAVGGLEPVDLRNGPGDNDAHGVGHVVGLQRVGDGLFHHRRVKADDVGRVYLMLVVVGFFLFGQV